MGESGREIEFLARPNVKMRLCPRCRWGRRKSGIKGSRYFQQSPGSQEDNSIFLQSGGRISDQHQQQYRTIRELSVPCLLHSPPSSYYTESEGISPRFLHFFSSAPFSSFRPRPRSRGRNLPKLLFLLQKGSVSLSTTLAKSEPCGIAGDKEGLSGFFGEKGKA